ncbi:MAG: type II secretion system protein [Patescibacteria group bacterium]
MTKLTTYNLQPTTNSGFTLIEMLVAVLIVGILGVVGTNSLFSLLRGASKTENIKEIKQNGDYALYVMEVKLRNGRDITSGCAGSATNTLTILNPDDTTRTEYSCAIYGTIRRIREEVRNNVTGVLIGNTNYLTNTTVTLAAANCTSANFYTCTEAPTSGLKTVSINFSLQQSGTVPTPESAQLTFKTQVSLRNQ